MWIPVRGGGLNTNILLLAFNFSYTNILDATAKTKGISDKEKQGFEILKKGCILLKHLLIFF